MKKGAIELDELIRWILVIVGLVIIAIVIFVLREKGVSAIDYIRDLWRFGK